MFINILKLYVLACSVFTNSKRKAVCVTRKLTVLFSKYDLFEAGIGL